MFDNSTIYTLRTENIEGITHYYVSFLDGQAVHRETEVSHAVYLEFQNFVKIECSLRHWNERYREYSELTDETLHKRALYPQKSVDETAFGSLQSEQLRLAIESLPEIQRRRFILYHEYDLTYEQIAKIDGCTITPVKLAIDRAKADIREKMKYFKSK